jgi:hypothetical protein
MTSTIFRMIIWCKNSQWKKHKFQFFLHKISISNLYATISFDCFLYLFSALLEIRIKLPTYTIYIA